MRLEAMWPALPDATSFPKQRRVACMRFGDWPMGRAHSLRGLLFTQFPRALVPGPYLLLQIRRRYDTMGLDPMARL